MPIESLAFILTGCFIVSVCAFMAMPRPDRINANSTADRLLDGVLCVMVLAVMILSFGASAFFWMEVARKYL